MTSERYLCRDKVRISCKNEPRLVGVIAVRRRLMKAVFLLRDESKEPLASEMSVYHQHGLLGPQAKERTLIPSPYFGVELAQLIYSLY